MPSYEWKDGVRLGVRAQLVGERLDELRAIHADHLTPRIVVDDARPPGTPMHDAFEWDDAKAAEQQRLDTARRLIRSVRVIHVSPEGEETPILGYIHAVVPDEGHVYVTTQRAMSSPELRAQVFQRAEDDLRAWQRRYEHIQEIAPLIDAVMAAARRAARPKRRAGGRPQARPRR